jgi:hypothetical protein
MWDTPEILALTNRAFLGKDGRDLLRGVGSFSKMRVFTPNAHRTQFPSALHHALARPSPKVEFLRLGLRAHKLP